MHLDKNLNKFQLGTYMPMLKKLPAELRDIFSS